MRQRRLASVVAGITAAFALTAAPARAGDPVFVPESFGEGAVVGTLTCAPDGVTSITIDSPAFVFDGELGELHATGTVNCHEPNQLSNAGFSGSFDITAPGVTCTDLGGGFIYLGPRLHILTAGDCTFADGSTDRMQLHVEAAYSHDVSTFAGEGLFSATP